MSNVRQKYQAYASATQTVAKTQQIVMLYDGAIRYIQQAKEAIREKRIEDRYHLLVKAGEIIVGLQSCLDFENGKDIAKILYNFYSSIDSRLFAIHRSNSMEACDEVITELKQMREVWHEIDAGKTQEEPLVSDQNKVPGTQAAAASSQPPTDADGSISLSA
jgi:flagellar protein FliS